MLVRSDRMAASHSNANQRFLLGDKGSGYRTKRSRYFVRSGSGELIWGPLDYLQSDPLL